MSTRAEIVRLVKLYLPNQPCSGRGITSEVLRRKLKNSGHYLSLDQIGVNPDIDMLIVSHVDDRTLSILLRCSHYFHNIGKSKDLWRRKLEIRLRRAFAPVSTVNYRALYKDVHFSDGTAGDLYTIAAKYGLIAWMKEMGPTDEYYKDAMCAAAGNDQLDTFNYLQSINTTIPLSEVIQPIVDVASDRVFTMLAAHDLVKDIPELSYDKCIHNLKNPDTIKKIFAKLASIVHLDDPMGFRTWNNEIGLTSHCKNACQHNNLMLLDILVNLVVSSDIFFVRDQGLFLCNNVITANHLLKSKIHLALALRLYPDQDPEHMLLDSIIYNGIDGSPAEFMQELLAGISQAQFDTLTSTTLYYLCISRKMIYALNSNKISLANRLEDLMLYAEEHIGPKLYLYDYLFMECGLPCNETMSWWSGLKDTTKKKLQKYIHK